MDQKKNHSSLWIETGYRLFAEEGPDGIVIKKIGRIIGASRTNFYYHFNTREIFIKCILDFHRNYVDEFIKEIQHHNINTLKAFNKVLANYSTGLKFQRQLYLNRDSIYYRKIFKEIDAKAERIIIPIVLKHFNIAVNNEKAIKLAAQLRHIWYTKLDVLDLNNENLNHYTSEIYGILQKAVNLFAPDK